MLVGVFGPVAAVTLLHYLTSHEYHPIHDILRRVYYIPIVIGALYWGVKGGLVVAGTVALAYFPHAFILPHHFDPARGMEKTLEIVLYFAVGGVAGYLSGKERRQRDRLERALAEQRRLSEQLIRAGRLSALGETVAGIAHEVKNPLHGMAGTVEIIDPLVPADAPERRMWEIHKSEIARLGRVADRFLSFARPAPAAMAPIDLRDVARRISSLTSASARRSRVDLEVAVPDRPIPVSGDTDQLAQIGVNILMNAQRALGEGGGKVRITTGDDGEQGFIAIENDGPPIPEGELESLFDPFYSGTDSTGLGMSISSRIATAHDGYITAENAGLGVRFTLRLPLRQARHVGGDRRGRRGQGAPERT